MESILILRALDIMQTKLLELVFKVAIVYTFEISVLSSGTEEAESSHRPNKLLEIVYYRSPHLSS